LVQAELGAIYFESSKDLVPPLFIFSSTFARVGQTCRPPSMRQC